MRCASRPSPMLVSAALAPGVIMLASFTPTPLFPEYQARWGIGESGVSVLFAAYPAGVVLCLALLGGLSDVVGRRRTIVVGGLVLTAALVLLSLAPNPGVMAAGRLMQGVGVGLVSTAAASALMELHPRGVESGSQFNTASVSFGVAIGPLLSGFLAEHLPAPFTTPYLLVAALVLVPVTIAALSPERRPAAGSSPASRPRLVRPVRVPQELRRPFVASAAAVAVTNTCTGLMGAFGPEVASTLGWHGSALSGVFVSVVLTAIAVAQVLGGRIPAAVLMLGGGTGAVVGWLTLTLGSVQAHAPIALVGVTVLGLGAGATLLGSASAMSGWAPPERRGEIYAAWLLVPFTTLGLSAFLAAPLLASTSLVTVLLSVAGVTAAATALVALTVRVPAPNSVPNTPPDLEADHA